MSILSIISFFICFSIIAYSFRRESDFFSPAKVFGIIWSASIGLAELKLSRLQHEWDAYGWLMLGIGTFSFLIGTYTVYAIHFQLRYKSLKEIRKSFNKEMVDSTKFLKVIYLLFLVYMISYLGNYLIEGYIPVFHKNPGQSRMEWGVFGIGLTIHIATPLLLVIIEYIKLVKPKTILKLSLSMMAVFTFISYLFLLQRFNLMFAIIAVLVFLYYSSNFLKSKNIVYAALSIVGLMYSVQYLRGSSLALSYLFIMAKMKFNFKYAIFTEPYMYISMNLENFTRAVGKLENYTFGYYSFNFLTSISGIRKSLAEYLALNHFPYLNSNYNTYSMFWDFYRDFGVIGLTTIPFLLGFTVSTVYYRMKIKPTLFNLSVYSVCVFIIFMSFFVSVIGLLHFVFNFSIIILVTKLVQTKVTTFQTMPN
ncbi:MAG: oligosaccharide repeat unit polymerase [Stygiobacter sp.]|nr:MAG: oligosaccharide repeat unit polymerase [Stygiobacter sp.]